MKYRPSAAGRQGTIFYQIIRDRKVRQIYTDYHLFEDEWDHHRAMVTANPSKERETVIIAIRQRIRWDMLRLLKIDQRLDADGMSYTSDDVVEEFRQYQQRYSLFNYMESLIIKFRQNAKDRTAETYNSTLSSFRKFRNDKDLMLESLSSEIMVAFEAWHKRKGNSPNTISFYTRILRAVYNRAVEEEVIDNHNPFRRVYTGIEKTSKRALPLKVIKRMKSLDLSLTPSLEYARDMFMMSFYLRGMSFIDMSFLRKADLKNGSVVYRRRKTGQLLTIRWTPEMQAIVDKYPSNHTQYLLPIIRKAGCNERNAYRNAGALVNYNLKKVALLAGVEVPVTMYVARHSWASAAKTKGIPLSVISEGMGHDSEATTRIYLTALETSIVDDANNIILSSL